MDDLFGWLCCLGPFIFVLLVIIFDEGSGGSSGGSGSGVWGAGTDRQPAPWYPGYFDR